MRIGFEAKRFFTNFTGLGNYARFVVDALSEFNPHDHYTLYSPKTRSHPEIDPIVRRPNVQVVAPTGGYRFLKGLWRSWGVSRHNTVPTLDVYHGLSQELPAGLPARVKKIVTVHDLIYIRYPQFYKPVDVAIYKAKAKAACAKADRVVAISQQTAQDIIDFLHVDSARIDVVYQGCHPIFKQTVTAAQQAAVRARYNLPAQFMLNVGTVESRKNVNLIVQALAVLPPALRLPLVIVGRETPYKEEIIRTATEKGVLELLHFLHGASFQDFPALYQSATVFVYPSLFEGFGIPLVEAIESGVPVVTSTGSCFREAAGCGALYADPQQPETLAAALEQVLADATLRTALVAQGRAYIEQFQPAVIAANLQQVYRR
jgi:glycosyltransferase involved in cell wall biosynthesis